MREKTAIAIGLVGSILLCLSGWLASPWGLGFSGRTYDYAIRWSQAGPALVGGLLLFAAWWWLRGKLTVKQLWLTFACWAVPLMVCPALLSKDAWAYLEQGWIALNGYDPYQTPLSSIGGPFGDRVDFFWQGTTTVYPPLALLIQAAVVALSGADPLWSLLAMRIPGLISMIMIGWAAATIAKCSKLDEATAVWFGLLNPLALITLLGGMHNDGWAIAVGLAGVAVAMRWPHWGWFAGAVLVGLAMGIKQPLGLMVVGVALGARCDAEQDILASWKDLFTKKLGISLLCLATTLASFALLNQLTWGFGWLSGSGMPFTTATQSLTHLFASLIAAVAGGYAGSYYGFVSPIMLGAGLGLMVWFGFKYLPRQPLRFMALGLIIFSLAYPSLQPWYILWGLLALAVVPLKPNGWRLAAAVTLYFIGTSVLLDYAVWLIPQGQGVSAGLAVLGYLLMDAKIKTCSKI